MKNLFFLLLVLTVFGCLQDESVVPSDRLDVIISQRSSVGAVNDFYDAVLDFGLEIGEEGIDSLASAMSSDLADSLENGDIDADDFFMHFFDIDSTVMADLNSAYLGVKNMHHEDLMDSLNSVYTQSSDTTINLLTGESLTTSRSNCECNFGQLVFDFAGTTAVAAAACVACVALPPACAGCAWGGTKAKELWDEMVDCNCISEDGCYF